MLNPVIFKKNFFITEKRLFFFRAFYLTLKNNKLFQKNSIESKKAVISTLIMCR